MNIHYNEFKPLNNDTFENWKSVTSHTHHVRTEEGNWKNSNQNLLDYCDCHNIKAVGVGSPWTEHHRDLGVEHETNRDAYYAKEAFNDDLMLTEDINKTLEDLGNKRPDTCFYIDSETPKMRHGHIWWFGYQYDMPYWHDYSQDQGVALWRNDENADINQITGMPQTRRSYREILHFQRSKGALGVWAHPTSWWLHENSFVTNIATEAGLHYALDGYLDGLAIQGYDAFHKSYQELWFHLLDQGGIVPGFSETDHCFDHPMVGPGKSSGFNTFLSIEGNVDLNKIKSAARAGHAFASSGLLLTMEIENYIPGDSVLDLNRHYELSVYFDPNGQEAGEQLELVGKGGKVLHTIDKVEKGEYKFNISDMKPGDWVLARVRGKGEGGLLEKDVKNHAITNPFYFSPKTEAFVKSSNITFQFSEQWLGNDFTVLSRNGEQLTSGKIEKSFHEQLPPDSILKIKNGKNNCIETELTYESSVIRNHLTSLFTGTFRAKYPDLPSGDVPPECFGFNEMSNALKEFKVIF